MQTAPVDERSLGACLAPFPDEARTLPREAYISTDVLEWERAHFFDGGWVCVGRSSDLPDAGDQRALVAGLQGLVLVRGDDNALRCFSNVCRHRGHELLACGAGSVNRPVLQCPYHRWTYALDGSFKGGPGMAGQPGFDADDPGHGLLELPAGEWGGWIFVNASGDAPSLEEHLGGLAALARPYEAERLSVAATHRYTVAANWKLIVENYHECYHCTEIHPELCRVSPPGSGFDYEPSGVVIGGSMELADGAETMSLDGRSGGVRMRALDDAAARFVHYAGFFPGLLISLHPDYVMTHRLEPVAPDETEIECTWLFPPEAGAIAGFDPSYAVDFWDLTNRQDWTACESVQRGVANRGYRQAPFSARERIVYQAMVMVARGYLDGRVAPVQVSSGAEQA